MAYLTITLNHFRAVQAWITNVGAEASLDVGDFKLEVRFRNRYYKFFPQFHNKKDGRLQHAPALTPDGIGFIGWLPYQPLRWDLSSDKLLFKQFLASVSERTPQSWRNLSEVSLDYVLKRSSGSFGYELSGPFKASQAASQNIVEDTPGLAGTPYAEQFIAGENIKVWFWGETPIYAQVHAYPEVVGDGKLSIEQLVSDRLLRIGQSLRDSDPDSVAMRLCIAYQQMSMQTILTAGQRAWLDYRYGRFYQHDPVSARSDNAVATLSPQLAGQLQQLGLKLDVELQKQFSAPVLWSVDGVIDSHEQIWWLEMNSNPVFPPDGYSVMFRTLFGTA